MPTASGGPLEHEHDILNKLLDITSNPEDHKKRITELTNLLQQTTDRLDEARKVNLENQERAAELTKRESAVAGREALADQREAVLGEVATLLPQLVQTISGLMPKINAFGTAGQSGKWRGASGPSGSKTTGQV